MILFPADGSAYIDYTISVDDLLLGLELDGVSWVFTKLDGWHLGGGVDPTFTARPGRHGALDGPMYRRERVIGVEGTCLSTNRGSTLQAIDTLASTLADGSSGQFRVDHTVIGSRSASVRLSAPPQMEWVNGNTFRWSLQFTAPDYRKYGEAQTGTCGLPSHGGGLTYPLAYPLDYGTPGDPGRVSVTNTGNAASEPTFTVEPTLASGFEITRVETGQRLRYAAPVTSTLTLDCAAGTVLTDGQRRERYLTVRQWPSLLPGESATFQFSTLGSETPATTSASLSVSFSPAFS